LWQGTYSNAQLYLNHFVYEGVAGGKAFVNPLTFFLVIAGHGASYVAA